MPAVVTDRNYRQVLSTALAMRAPGIEDLVSNANPIYNVLARGDRVRDFTGPEIRQTLQIDKQMAQWFKGYDFLANPPIELFNDAVWTPKSVAVPISLTGQEIRANQGSTQIHDILEAYMDAAENALVDAMDEALMSDGTADGGKQLTGLAGALPTNPATAGVYGGIDRNTVPLWRSGAYDIQTAFPDIGTQVTVGNIRQFYSRIFSLRSRNMRRADLLLASREHYEAYEMATQAIQRIVRPESLGALGFTALEYIGAGGRAQIVEMSGLNANMPSNTTFGVETRSLILRRRPGANFSPLFDGDGQKPINQDAIAQFVLWEGELTLINPLFSWRMWDSDPET